jgi:hypothetical protein
MPKTWMSFPALLVALFLSSERFGVSQR